MLAPSLQLCTSPLCFLTHFLLLPNPEPLNRHPFTSSYSSSPTWSLCMIFTVKNTHAHSPSSTHCTHVLCP